MIFDYLHPIDISKADDISRVVKSNNDRWIYAQTNSKDKWRFAVDIDRLDPTFIEMLLRFEDKNFYHHYGIDILAICRAVGQLVRYQRIVSGGSTITMQLARLLDPKPRTIISKLQEIINAFQIELHYSKDEILSLYLTLTPYGGNIEGVVGASMRYFGKLPKTLTASESALLVSLPQSPERNRPDRYIENSIKARNKVLKVALENSIISSFEYRQAIDSTPPTKLKAYPRSAPHLSHRLLTNTAIDSREINTTLDSTLQKQIEIWAKDKSDILPKDTTISLLVVKNSNSSILTYLGSHDIFSDRVSGYVDMVRAIRSPGSTLKPFIYAFGFERHIIHPNSIIMDEETLFGDYKPHNFSKSFSGEVTISNALRYSLNIPAVKVLQRVGVEEFIERVERVSGELKLPQKRATLPIALGGVGISLWQLTQLYVALANGGSANRLHYRPSDAILHKRLCDYKSSKMTTAILRGVTPPEGFINRNNQIAYKTGTSYGYRDNWTIAYNRDYTVAVWVGKPNNATQPKRTGREVAAPLAYELFGLLHILLPQKDWGWHDNYLGSSVPEGLRYFEKDRKIYKHNRLDIVSPQKNARFRSAGCSAVRVEIKVAKGLKPYYWYIDGDPVDIKGSSTTLPFDHGAHTITILDSSGNTMTRDIWIDRPECSKY
jgi:penicillin-binding protein 1C